MAEDAPPAERTSLLITAVESPIDNIEMESVLQSDRTGRCLGRVGNTSALLGDTSGGVPSNKAAQGLGRIHHDRLPRSGCVSGFQRANKPFSLGPALRRSARTSGWCVGSG